MRCICFVLGLMAILPSTIQATERPNILFLIADDLGWADVGWHDSDINTPHLDRLARNGVILDQHYVTPMCSSTRACLLSGRYSTRFGLDGATNSLVYPHGMTTLASALQAVGYQTALTGKWHLGSRPEWGPMHFGFHHSYGSLAGGVDQYLHLYKKGRYQRTWQRDHEFVEEEGHATDLIAGEALRWIRSSESSERPWYIQVAFTAVHVPIQEPQQWVEPYVGKIENESRRRFAGCATHMDHAIGELVTALRETGQFENTLIIFTSDNGGSGPWSPSGLYPGEYDACPVLGLNHPLRGRKGTVYEGGIRVPAFVHWPNHLPSGVTLNQPIHMVDWMPTLLKLTGYDDRLHDLEYDGHDIWPQLTGNVATPESRTLYFRRGSASALRHGQWKLVTNGPKEELFDLSADPNESHDVSGEQPAKLNELRELLKAQQDREQGAQLAAATEEEDSARSVKKLILPGESFLVNDRPAFIMWPEESRRQTPQPWVMYGPTLPGLPDRNEQWMHEQLLEAGVAVVGVDVGEAYGSPAGQQAMTALYEKLTSTRGFARQACVLGRSRGGLLVSSWAIARPEYVSGFAGIYPVLDLRSYPGLKRAAPAYGLSPEQLENRLEQLNPIARGDVLANARIPVCIIHGDVDKVVPLEPNSAALIAKYEARDQSGLTQLIVAEGQGHNLWPGFFRCQELIDFAIARARAGAAIEGH